ncbi:MAG: hypothetical protein COY42_09790 [Armatimonadetes bacterium CG_4_10_14_0_8_um_filter_66_14]|nr:MAG: hypothetical protein COS65_15955 [Armatimonadetes bacterium CG06_land_8_20_14_3_00_66_21]PIZ46891.1 MAG: hypothetical protein COY42_09790 [Armatimonadetes bacterium CG_4_10_14_0_8_um_filter_66_14]
MALGLKLGWGGLLQKVRYYRHENADAGDFYDGLEDVITGVQDWVRRHAEAARSMAEAEQRPQLRENLATLADICARQVCAPPETFREACQWLVFFQAVAKMYNGSGEWGQLDKLLRPYYERDSAAGLLTDDEAVFHLACLLLSETAYIQLGGPDADGQDLTSRVSFLVLEAVHRLKTPANLAVRVGQGLSEELFRRGLEILCEDRMGFPKFVGDRAVTEGFMRNGYPVEVARTRTYAGCHWLAIPGREYGMCDMIKIDLARVFDLAFWEATEAPCAAGDEPPSVADLWLRFEREQRLTWDELARHLKENWAGDHGERARLMMRNVPRFGSGGSLADEWALRLSRTFTDAVAGKPTPDGFRMVPGLFSWAKVIAFGQRLGATPNGRRAGEPVSHGPNPEPGFNGGGPGTPTQMVAAVAAVQPGYGNTAPLQLDVDPGVAGTALGVSQAEALVRGHFQMGGTLVNLNVLNKETILEAAKNPEKHPDLIVRVTGFSAYFASLSDDMRQYVADRLVQGE